MPTNIAAPSSKLVCLWRWLMGTDRYQWTVNGDVFNDEKTAVEYAAFQEKHGSGAKVTLSLYRNGHLTNGSTD